MALSKSDQIRALRERQHEQRSKVIISEIADVTGIVEVVNKAANLINSNAAYQAKWRLANLETNRQRARDGMRKRRAELKRQWLRSTPFRTPNATRHG